MKNVIFIVAILLTLVNCSRRDVPKSYLDNADEVEFYRIPKKLEDMLSTIHTESERKNSVAYRILTSHDAGFIKSSVAMDVLNNDFDNYKVAPDILAKIKNCIDVRRSINEASFANFTMLCEPYFRDVLIFRKKEKIIYIAKICLECRKYSVYPEGSNIEHPRIDFEALETVLDEAVNSSTQKALKKNG